METGPNVDFSGLWKLVTGESEFGFLPVPKFRLDKVVHDNGRIRIETHQIDSNGDNVVVRDLAIGGEPVEVDVLGKARWIRVLGDGDALKFETRSSVSGNERLIEDWWSLDETITDMPLTVRRTLRQPGGAVHQKLRFRRGNFV